MAEAVAVGLDKSSIEQTLIHIVEDLTQDWGIELGGAVSSQTRLVADMEFASVDIIQLMVAIEEHYNRPKMGFQDLLMNDGSYVDDLSIGQVIDFVHARLTGVPA
ncbi:acyl carrier protein [Pseudomonas sp. R-28-1W-6]|uniref:acyl carrier protein n=1 Tax=Pseudomonas sp. R-28-1W-6 TaxID=2650101 RepID=UPI0013656600|nr:acyl carrier protein [Pseudomonas sp. R-28-1W-6]MWV11417.1 acyl carrier protein [Pseudomonas sp. R-28-1W-6]